MIELASLAAILALTALAWAMGFRAAPALDLRTAADEAEARLAGFRAAETILAIGGKGAVLSGQDGSVAMLLPLADGWIARRLPRNAVQCAGGQITARLDEPLLPSAQLSLDRCPPWLGGSA